MSAVKVDAEIESIDSFGRCEDGRTFMLICTTTDGRALIVSACEGEMLTVNLAEPDAALVAEQRRHYH